ncbi:MAG: UbiH/UbiF/VisC/COQ6 family ubiquinone biosynthesis hydroxylase [Candidatus Eiseniibacteriota bacterium]
MAPARRHSAAVLDADVLVIGGGMVGLTLAVALGGAGLEVVVVDRADPKSQVAAAFDGRTSAIAHGSKRALEAIDLWPAMAPDAEPILDIRVSDGASPLFLHYDHREVGDAPLGYIIENRATRHALFFRVGNLDGVTLKAPMSVASLEAKAGAVEAVLGDGTTVRASLAVGADGPRSWVRRQAGIALAEWRYKQTGIVCTMAHERPHRGIAHERFLPAGPFAVLPMTDDASVAAGRLGRFRSSIVWTEREDLAPAMLALDDAAFSDELAARFGDYYGTVRVAGPRWSYPLALHHAESYVAPRLALIGDAAHLIHPIAGQGLNLGLRDVAALAEALIDAARLGLDIGGADVLQRYQRWRRFDNTVLIAATDGLNRLFSNDVPAVRLVRDLGLGAVNRVPPVKRFFMRHAMGVVGELPRLLRGEAL